VVCSDRWSQLQKAPRMSSVTGAPLTVDSGGRVVTQAEFDSSEAWGLLPSVGASPEIHVTIHTCLRR